MSDQCGSVTTKNKQNWLRSRGVLFLRAKPSNKTFSFSSENKEKIPGVETNPLSAAIHIILTFTWIMQMKKVWAQVKGNCKYILTPAVFQNHQVNCSFVEWPMFPILLVLPMLYLFLVICISYVDCSVKLSGNSTPLKLIAGALVIPGLWKK